MVHKPRSSHQRRSMKKGVFKNFAKLTGKYLCQSLFINYSCINYFCSLSHGSCRHCVKSVQIRSFFWSVFSCIRTFFMRDWKVLQTCNLIRYKPQCESLRIYKHLRWRWIFDKVIDSLHIHQKWLLGVKIVKLKLNPEQGKF